MPDILPFSEMHDKMILENQKKAKTIYANVKETTKGLSQVDSAIVKRLVTGADILAFPAKYYSGCEGEVKNMASYETEELAFAGDVTTAKTLTEYYYPAEDTIIIIERR